MVNQTYNATPITKTWGSENLVSDNSLNFLNASIEAWREVGQAQIAMDFMFGFIPIVLLITLYIRTKRIAPSLIVGLLTTYMLSVFDLVSSQTSSFLLIALGLGLGVVMASMLSKKKITYT